MVTLSTTKNDLVVKTAAIRKKQLPINRGQANRSSASPSALSAWSVWSDKFASPN